MKLLKIIAIIAILLVVLYFTYSKLFKVNETVVPEVAPDKVNKMVFTSNFVTVDTTKLARELGSYK